MVTPNVRLVRQLAEGAMGSVWMAENVALEAHVAVKFISAEKGPAPEDLRRFQREAKAAAQINSQHVVRTFDYGVMGGDIPFIVLELLEGESLQQMLERQGHLSIADTVQVVAHVSRALEAAHGIGIVHRDVKPANVFRTHSDGAPVYKLLDFGVAKYSPRKRVHLESDGARSDATAEERLVLTLAGTLVGTPEYMSPEQIADDGAATRHADVWALAVVAYQCLTGALPFRGADVGKLSLAILLGEFTPPTQLKADLGEAADQLFHKAFSREKSERFDHVTELAESIAALRSAKEDAGDSGAPHPGADSPQGGIAQVARRGTRPGMLWAVALAALFAVAVAWLMSRPPGPRPTAPRTTARPSQLPSAPPPGPLHAPSALPSAGSSGAPVPSAAAPSSPMTSSTSPPVARPKKPPTGASTSTALPPRNLGF